jgi:hypothetical protein
MKHVWFSCLAVIVRVAGCHAANPLIYGILDKKMITFWKFCRKKGELTVIKVNQ